MSGYLTDTLIISNPAINEIPKFAAIAGSAVYILHHDSDGAIGVRLNKNYAKTVAEIGAEFLPAFALVDPESLITAKTIFGGPVGENLPWILGRNLQVYEQQVRNSVLALNFSDDAFSNNTPEYFSICGVGTFGWGAGQIEKEMASFLWHQFPATEEALNSIPFDNEFRGAAQVIMALKFDGR